ncbi:hypothetical protein HZF24_18570 [Sedimentibacter hydroxybenzoicus DSM 7310]|uniref:Uncharacterized protein n=1 Tax=Sedimentibacter hydroxybenzoicus DSM 7310 TaxID=1123245 RepID=A0A974BNA3_SEDHY|nr:hypothetical protein [Sedimentibacter hydroxybenzoicus]NYB76153.1 hypothetical protein [Sedimentibacter hydroxybenzoicus DSM 7310]
MTYREVFLSLVILIIFAGTVISTVLIPLYRLLTFKNKVAYINDKYFENKILATIFIILFPVLIFLTITNILDLIDHNFDYLLFIKILRIFMPIYAIFYTIARLPKQCIYKEGIKSNLFFVKWNEVERIEQENHDLKIYYNYRYIFFKIRHVYVIKDFSSEIKELLYKFNGSQS